MANQEHCARSRGDRSVLVHPHDWFRREDPAPGRTTVDRIPRQSNAAAVPAAPVSATRNTRDGSLQNGVALNATGLLLPHQIFAARNTSRESDVPVYSDEPSDHSFQRLGPHRRVTGSGPNLNVGRLVGPNVYGSPIVPPNLNMGRNHWPNLAGPWAGRQDSVADGQDDGTYRRSPRNGYSGLGSVRAGEMTYEEMLELQERIGFVGSGLSHEAVGALLPKQKYQSSVDKDEVCCVCQEEYKEGEEIVKLKCKHQFHFECIREWFSRKNLCPVCRRVGLSVRKTDR